MGVWQPLSHSAQDAAVRMTIQQLIDGKMRTASLQNSFLCKIWEEGLFGGVALFLGPQTSFVDL